MGMKLPAEKMREVPCEKKKCNNCLYMKKINNKKYICTCPIPLSNANYIFCNDIEFKDVK